MTTNVSNQTSFLRTSREFPEDLRQLSIEINKCYFDIANAVNSRTISIFPKNRSAVNGENWFLTNQRQQGSRQVYTFSAAGSIPHTLNLASIFAFTRIYGTFTDGKKWYPLPYVDVVYANNQVNVIIDSTNIVIAVGGGAPPVITSGYVVLEWISKASV